MKIIQLATLPETESDYAQVFGLTDEGKVLRCVMNGNLNWKEFAPISEQSELAATDSQHTQLAIAALRGALSRLPVNLGMVDQILVAFEEELQQQAGA